MIMTEVLNTSPPCSASVYSSSHMYSHSRIHDFRIPFRCISCSAYFNWGLKMNMNRAKNHGFGVVAFAGNSSLRTTAQKAGEIALLCKPGQSKNVCAESFYEGVTVMEEKEGLDENGSQSMVPPWGGSTDQELDDRDGVDEGSSTRPLKDVDESMNECSTRPSKAVDESMGEIFYLEERDEEELSKRILKLSRANKLRSALALFRSMDVSGLLPNSHACNSLLSCLIRNRRLDDAIRVFEFMRLTDIVTGHTYSLILKAVANDRSRDAALRMFEEAEREGKSKKCMDAVVYNTMIAIFGKVNDWSGAERMWRSLRENGCVGTTVTYRMLICIFVRCGQNELALDAYYEMLQNRLNPSEDAMQAIIGACSREGKWDTALDVLKSMLDNDMKPSIITCNALINSLGKAGEVELAVNVHDLLKSLGYAPDAYTWNGLLCALNRANRHSEALELFERIRREHGCVLNMHIYNTCLMSCQRLGLWERAMQLLWEMEGLDFPVPVTSYNLVIGACEAARKPMVALRVYEHMVEQKQKPDLFTLLSLIRSCIWGSHWDEVEKILNAEADGSLYNAAIQGFCLRKERDLARKLNLKMQKIGLKPDGKTRALMLQNLTRA